MELLQVLGLALRVQIVLPVEAQILELSVNLISLLLGQAECSPIDEGLDHPELVDDVRFARGHTVAVLNLK